MTWTPYQLIGGPYDGDTGHIDACPHRIYATWCHGCGETHFFRRQPPAAVPYDLADLGEQGARYVHAPDSTTHDTDEHPLAAPITTREPITAGGHAR